MAGVLTLATVAALAQGAAGGRTAWLAGGSAQAAPVATPATSAPATDARAAEVVALVDAAAVLVEQKGRAAFPELRDPRGRFFRGENYVFVTTPEGLMLVNPAMPAVEGTNLLQVRDADNRALMADYIRLAMSQGSGWVSYRWFRPTPPRTPMRKHTFVRKVVAAGGEVLVIGAGYYTPGTT